jgi:predicted O-linked N-acetylglucosamine transferase (SPINDLY family)
MENYIDLAVKIACDKTLRTEISNKIKLRNKVLFCNNNQAIREMEDVFKKMVSEIQIN